MTTRHLSNQSDNGLRPCNDTLVLVSGYCRVLSVAQSASCVSLSKGCIPHG
jgi:hypothetical protein